MIRSYKLRIARIFIFFGILSSISAQTFNVGYRQVGSTTNTSFTFEILVSKSSGPKELLLGGMTTALSFPAGAIGGTTAPTWTEAPAFSALNNPAPSIGSNKIRATQPTVAAANAVILTTTPVVYATVTVSSTTTLPSPLTLTPANSGSPALQAIIFVDGATTSSVYALSSTTNVIVTQTPDPSGMFVASATFALPIKLANFAATEKGASNLIVWETTEEINLRSFAVEKSADAKAWTVLGTTTPNPTKRYSMMDNNPATTTYYRLRNIDKDGREDVSKVVVVNRKKGTFNIASVSPNPTSDNLNVSFETADDAEITMTVVDALGKQVLSNSVLPTTGINNTNLDVSALPSGTYFLNVNNGNTVLTTKVVKQ